MAPERALQNSVEQLKRIVDEFADFDLFIVTPLTRYVAKPCCVNISHVTNFGEPGFLQNIISDLTKLKYQLKKKLQPATVLDGIELVCGAGCGREKIEQTLTAGWALDPVHPSSHVYAKMALNLIEAVAAPKTNADSRKRKRSEESRSGSGIPIRGRLAAAPPYPEHRFLQVSLHGYRLWRVARRQQLRLRFRTRIWVRIRSQGEPVLQPIVFSTPATGPHRLGL